VLRHLLALVVEDEANPAYKEELRIETTDTRLRFAMLGVGLTYYVLPANVYFTGVIGAVRMAWTNTSVRLVLVVTVAAPGIEGTVVRVALPAIEEEGGGGATTPATGSASSTSSWNGPV
jgi:hypothetical protein